MCTKFFRGILSAIESEILKMAKTEKYFSSNECVLFTQLEDINRIEHEEKYCQLKSKDFCAIDSFILGHDTINKLFQMTVSNDHPVSLVILGIVPGILKIKEKQKIILNLGNFYPWKRIQNVQKNCLPGSKMQ